MRITTTFGRLEELHARPAGPDSGQKVAVMRVVHGGVLSWVRAGAASRTRRSGAGGAASVQETARTYPIIAERSSGAGSGATVSGATGGTTSSR